MEKLMTLRFTAGAALVAALFPALALANTDTAPGQQKAEILVQSHQDVLPSLRAIAPKAIDTSFQAPAHDRRRVPYQDSPNFVDDFAAQTGHITNTSTAASTSAGIGFDGVGKGFTGPQGSFTVQSAPPDTSAAVGATQVVEWVNSSFAVFDKATGSATYGPAAGNTLFAGFGGACETSNDGDPVVMYDKQADRWVLMQFAVPSGGPYYQCIAVSKTNDATGAYNRYAFQYSGFNDYPKGGVWTDGYYVTYNIFNGNTFGGAKACAMDRTSMLAGLPATQQCFQLSTSYGGVLPADMDGKTLPPAGSPNYLVNLGTSSLNVWKFHVDWATPANTTLSAAKNVPVTAFSAACGGGTCIPQSGTSNQLDSLADRAMYRLAYRNFGTYESLIVNHAVKLGTTKRNSYTGTRWYELRNLSAAAPTVYQQSTFAPDTSSRWMGSVAMDKMGNMAMGYSVSSSALKPGLRYATRLAGDALNTLSNETTIVTGAGAQTGTLHRWGDYSAMTIDPVDDCTFWYAGEYIKADGTFNWSTHLASFKIAGCQ
jgi:hypothetical protein